MAQYRMNAYDADVYIPEFKGLMQYGDQMGADLRFSPNCMNCETPAGVLQPAPKLENVILRTGVNARLSASDHMCMMYLRATNFRAQPWLASDLVYSNGSESIRSQGEIGQGKEFDAYLFAVGGKLYEANVPAGKLYSSPISGYHLSEIYVNQISGTFSQKNWNWCTYETTFSATRIGDPDGKTNIIILGNDGDGLYYYAGLGWFRQISSSDSRKFAHIARFAERIWGVGTGEYRDTIYYSKAFKPFDWSSVPSEGEQPEDVGGMIREATFDNDKLVALIPFGDSLIAFSEQRAWRITGSDPSNFYIQEQYGNGTRYPKSIAVMDDRIIMLGEHGLVSYDGARVTPFLKEYTYEIFRDAQLGVGGSVEIGTPSAVAIKGKYILALSNKFYYVTSTKITNTGFRFLIYDQMDGSVTIMDCPLIASFCAEFPNIWATVVTPHPTSQNTQYFDILQLRFDSWDLKEVTSAAVHWETPWITFGRKDIQKGGFEMYFQPELNPPAADGPVTFTFSIETEKKKKTKTYTVVPLTAGQVAAGKKYKQKRIHFGGNGRRFKLSIDVAEGNTIPWRLIGGIHIIAETDQD